MKLKHRNLTDRFIAEKRLIPDALVDIDPDYAVSASDLPNRGTGGSGYDLDTNVGTAANRKIHPSGSCLLFGATGNYASTPDSAANSITGDIDIRARVAPEDWTAASGAQALASKYNTTGNQRAYMFRIAATSGALELIISGDGTATTTYASTAGVPFSDGEAGWVRVTLDVDNGASNSAATFYTSTDGETWTQLGAVRNSGGVVSIFDSSAPVEIGSVVLGTAVLFRGEVYRAQIYNGIDGTLAVDFDPTNYVSGTTFSSGGVTWTLNGNSFIQNTGHDVLHTIGSAALETASGQTISSPFTVFAVARYSTTPSADQYLFCSRSSTTALAAIYTNDSASDQFVISQDDTTEVGTLAFDNLPHVFTGQFNGGATTKLTVSGVGSATGNAGGDDWDFGTIFADEAGSNTMQGYIARLLVFDYALSETQVSAIQNYLSAYYSL